MKQVYEFVLSGMHYGKPTDDKNSGNYKYVHGGINPKTGKETSAASALKNKDNPNHDQNDDE